MLWCWAAGLTNDLGDVALTALRPQPVQGSQCSVGLSPNMADGALFTVFDVMGDHGRGDFGLPVARGRPSQRFKRAEPECVFGTSLDVTLPAIPPCRMRSCRSDPFTVVVRTGLVAVETVLTTQPHYLMWNHRGRSIVKREAIACGQQLRQAFVPLGPGWLTRITAVHKKNRQEKASEEGGGSHQTFSRRMAHFL